MIRKAGIGLTGAVIAVILVVVFDRVMFEQRVGTWVDATCNLIHLRVQLGATREAFDLLGAAVSSFPDDPKPTFSFLEAGLPLTRWKQSKHWTNT